MSVTGNYNSNENKNPLKVRTSLASLVDNINLNGLNTYYSKEDSLFKRRIDKLNIKFYIETEKFMTNKQDIKECQDQLFFILFKQISLYLEEIERLNKLVQEKKDEKTAKEMLEEVS
jgi:hypothetical protein